MATSRGGKEKSQHTVRAEEEALPLSSVCSPIVHRAAVMEEAKNKEKKQPEKTDEKDKEKEKGQQPSGKDKDKKEEQELVRFDIFLIQMCCNQRCKNQTCYFALVTAALTTWLSRPKSLPLNVDG